MLSERLSMTSIPAADAWERVMDERPELDLQTTGPDMFEHASYAGTYLNTAVTYAVLTGRNPEGLEFRPVDLIPDPDTVAPGIRRDVERMREGAVITDADAAYLQRIAWETVQQRYSAP